MTIIFSVVMAGGHTNLSSSIFVNASQNSADWADSLINLIESDPTKITDVNTIASYDPDPVNDQKHVLDESDHRSKTSRNCSVHIITCNQSSKVKELRKRDH